MSRNLLVVLIALLIVAGVMWALADSDSPQVKPETTSSEKSTAEEQQQIAKSSLPPLEIDTDEPLLLEDPPEVVAAESMPADQQLSFVTVAPGASSSKSSNNVALSTSLL